jgi:hypothetical protein
VSTSLKLTVVAVVSLVIGYFAGREHLKYEVRSAMQDAASELQSSLANAFGSDAESSRSSRREPAVPPPKAPEPAPLSVQTIC